MLGPLKYVKLSAYIIKISLAEAIVLIFGTEVCMQYIHPATLRMRISILREAQTTTAASLQIYNSRLLLSCSIGIVANSVTIVL